MEAVIICYHEGLYIVFVAIIMGCYEHLYIAMYVGVCTTIIPLRYEGVSLEGCARPER
jgi:hypothetical protein